MTKKEFLKELRKNLKGLSKSEIDDRIAFYSEMIDDRMEEGKSESKAVASLGSIDKIVEQIVEDTPISKLVVAKLKPKKELKAWEIVLIVISFPIWFPILITLVALVITLYVVIWAILISLWACAGSILISGIACFFSSFVLLFSGNAVSAFAILGASLAVAGLAILTVIGLIYLSKQVVILTKKITSSIKRHLVK